MHRSSSVRNFGFGVALALAASVAPPARAEFRADDLAKGYSEFGAALLKQVAPKRGNVMVSPVSIGLALDMVLAGSRGKTRAELAKLLGHGEAGDAELQAAAKALMAELTATPPTAAVSPPPAASPVAVAPAEPKAEADKETPSDASAPAQPAEEPKPAEEPQPVLASKPAERAKPEVALANALFFRRGGVLAEYRATIKEAFEAQSFDKLDLGAINGFVKEKTRGRIAEILTSLPTETAAVVLNALYFRADWATPFVADQTKPMPFQLSAKAKADVPTMQRRGDLPIIEGAGYRAVKLGYADTSLAMFVVLPDVVEGHLKVAAALDGDTVFDIIGKLRKARPQPVDLALPRFSAETNMDAARILRGMGLKATVCPGAADLTGMLEAKALKGRTCIDKIAHRVVVEVNEKGAEAAAATAVRISVRALQVPREPVAFKVDRPFIFFIADEKTGSVLILGRIADPRVKTS